MQIVLTKDLNPEKGYIRGTVLDWPRPTITAMTAQVGDEKWFKYSSSLERSMNRQALHDAERASKGRELVAA